VIAHVASGQSSFVAVGSGGQLRTSTDAITWTTQTSNFGTSAIFSVAYGNGLWIAGGVSGQIRTSTDTLNWTTQTSNFGSSIVQAINYGNGLWVAGGQSGQIRTSTNGITWTTQTSNFGATTITSIEYGNGLWAASGYGGALRTSTNGITWTTQTSNFGATNITSVSYGNGTWVASGYSGQIRTSTDSVTSWTIDSASYALLSSPTFTGTPAAPTASIDTNNTQIATTAYVIGQGYLKSATASSTYAPLSSPTFTGTPLSTTASAGTNTTQVATTEFVQTAVNTTIINTQTASYALVLGDAGEIIEMNVASANNLTVPLNSSVAFPIGTSIDIVQYGTGQTTIVATGGVTIRASGNKLKLTGQYSAATLYKRGTDEWVIMGDLSA
jgi:hypothetical protein